MLTNEGVLISDEVSELRKLVEVAESFENPRETGRQYEHVMAVVQEFETRLEQLFNNGHPTNDAVVGGLQTRMQLLQISVENGILENNGNCDQTVTRETNWNTLMEEHLLPFYNIPDQIKVGDSVDEQMPPLVAAEIPTAEQ